MGGITAALVTCPLEVIKTRLQAGQVRIASTTTFGTRLTSIFLDIWRGEGIRGLWRGLGPNLVGVAPSRAIHFSTYSGIKSFLRSQGMEESSSMHLLSAIGAGMTVHTLTSPLWLIKTRLQLQGRSSGSPYYNNSFDCIRKVWREEGVRGFYRGLVASYVGITESAMQFVLYEKFKHLMQVQKYKAIHGITEEKITKEQANTITLGTTEYLTVASLSKLIAAAATYPHEVVRTRMRDRRDAVKPKYHGFLQSLRLIAKEEGLAGLYGGMGVHLLRVVPNAAIMFLTYETILRVLTK
ncbi:hypothetical protein PROFUN_06242 [Planoprotostelium fungivorum]|uniref:Mitochondrial carrier protein n=1 Tax=Planoprotostelium fungivorum TaxID=1890364 RepID=A0A2P6NE55_9EUKA|nr:hypothetical protein PROFUN_06242 [Planoprotostelium fungivorum]